MTAAAPLATAARAAAGVAARRAAAATATPAATAVPAAAPGVAAAPSAPGVAPGSSGCTAASAWWAGTAGVASAPRAGTAGAVPAPPSRPPPLQPLLPVRPPVPLPSGCVLGFRGGTSAAATSITASAAAPRVVPLLPLRAGGAGTAGAVARWTAGGGATATGAARGGVVGGLPLTPHGGWRTLLTPPAGIRRPVGVPSTPAPWARSPSTSRGLESVLPRPKPPAAARARGGAAASGGAAAGGGGGGSGGSSVGRPGVWRRTPPPPRLPPGGRVRGVTALTASALGVAAAVTHEDRGAGLAILSAISDTSGPHTYGMGVLPPKGRVAVGAGLAAAAVAALGWLVWAATATAAPAVALGLLLAWATRPGAAELVGQMHAAAPAVARRKEGVVERVRVRVAPYLVRLQAMRVSDWGLFSVATVGDWVDYQYLYLGALNRWWLVGWWLDPESPRYPHLFPEKRRGGDGGTAGVGKLKGAPAS